MNYLTIFFSFVSLVYNTNTGSILPVRSRVENSNFTGFIGKYPISMSLKITEMSDGDVKYKGTYYYNKIGRRILLKGVWRMRPGTPTKIFLDEFVDGNKTGFFELMPKSYGDYSLMEGYWYGNSQMLKVKLIRIK
jgi:hypothetical protein